MGWGKFKRKVVFRWGWNVFVITCLIVLACGKEKKVDLQVGTKPVTLMVFGAAWCGVCKTAFPAIEAELAKLQPEQRKLINVEMYVPTGPNPARRPTQQDAEDYQKASGLTATAFADVDDSVPGPRPTYTKYEQLVGSKELGLPGGVIMDAAGKVLQVFLPGETNFVPNKIVSSAVRATL